MFFPFVDVFDYPQHWRKCKRLGLPYVEARRHGDYASIYVDFYEIDFDMIPRLGDWLYRFIKSSVVLCLPNPG